MGGEEQVANLAAVESLVQEVTQGVEVAQRLGHLVAVHAEMLGVQPVADELLSGDAFRWAKQRIRQLSLDSRAIRAGDLFIAIRGDRFDGHDYVEAALARGAVGAIVLAVLQHKACSRRALIAARIGGGVALVLAFPGLVIWLDERAPAGLLAAANGFMGMVKTPLFFVFYLSLAAVLLEAAIIVELRKLISQGMDSTMRITAMVIFILIGSSLFTLVFRGVQGDVWIEGLLTSLPGGVTGFLIFVNIFVFVLAFFLDFFEIAFIIIPLLAPVAAKLGIDLIWFGVLLGANMQTSFMHPPFGFALFYLRGIAPKEVKSSDIYWGAIPWVILQLILVAILVFCPGLVTAFLDKEKVIDTNKVRIEVPVDSTDPSRGGAKGAPGSTDEDDPTKALERALRGSEAKQEPR